MYQGYLRLGSTEIANAQRVARYVQNIMPGFPLRDCVGCEGIERALGTTYNSPLQDGAPWIDPSNTATYDFLGFYPITVQGLDSSTVVATVTESITDGGYLNSSRARTRDIRVRGVLVATSELGLAAGQTWLNEALRGDPCEDGNCNGYDLSFYAACPEFEVCYTDFNAGDQFPVTGLRPNLLVPIADTLEQDAKFLGAIDPNHWDGLTFTWGVSRFVGDFSNYEEDIEVRSGPVTPWRVNKVRNPRFAVDTALWGTDATLSRVATGGPDNDPYGHLVFNAGLRHLQTSVENAISTQNMLQFRARTDLDTFVVNIRSAIDNSVVQTHLFTGATDWEDYSLIVPSARDNLLEFEFEDPDPAVRENLVQNPSPQVNDTGWAGIAATAFSSARTAGTGVAGDYGYVFTFTDNSVSGNAGPQAGTTTGLNIPVVAGETIYPSMYVRSNVSRTGVVLRAFFFDAANAVVSSPTSTPFNLVANAAYQQVTMGATVVPVGATHVAFRIVNPNAVTTPWGGALRNRVGNPNTVSGGTAFTVGNAAQSYTGGKLRLTATGAGAAFAYPQPPVGEVTSPGFTITTGTPYAVRVRVTNPNAFTTYARLGLSWYTAAGIAAVPSSTLGAIQTIAPGATVVIELIGTVPAHTSGNAIASMLPITYNYLNLSSGTPAAGTLLDVSEYALFTGTTAPTVSPVPYFDGGTVETGRTIAWTGTANASPSTRTGDWVAIDRANTANGTYFDGNTADTPSEEFVWSGTAYASTSLAEGPHYFDVTQVIVEGGTQFLPYFDGSTLPDMPPTNAENAPDPEYAVAWEGTANASESQMEWLGEAQFEFCGQGKYAWIYVTGGYGAVTVSYGRATSISDEEQALKFERYARDVGRIEGPTVTREIAPNTGYARIVEFSLNASTPFIYSRSGRTYDWGFDFYEPTEFTDTTPPEPPPSVVIDPDCPPVPDPPRPPIVENDCVVTPGTWDRYAFAINAEDVSRWSSIVPRISLTPGVEMRQMRFRTTPNPLGVRPSRTNLALRPYPNAAGGWQSGSAIPFPATLQSVGARRPGTQASVINRSLTALDNRIALWNWIGGYGTAAAEQPVAVPDFTHYFSLYYKAVNAPSTPYAFTITWFNGGGAPIGSDVQAPQEAVSSSGVWSRATFSAIAPSAAARVLVGITFYTPTGGLATGDEEVWIQDLLIETGGSSSPSVYFDGDMADDDSLEYAFTGTAFQSTSTATIAAFAYDSEFIVSYSPAGATVVVDSTTRRAEIVLDSSTAPIPAGNLLYGSNGGPMEWPEFTCGTAYFVTVDVPVGTGDDLNLLMELTRRE